MALVIASQPDANDLLSAYNPVPFVVFANQPTSGDPCPVVYADVYFDGVYYGTFSSTVYYGIVGPYAEYHFDIQDKCQEFLRSKLWAGIGVTQNNGIMYEHFTSCYVKFRETDIDTDGFTVSVGTAPVQGTFFDEAVGGDGEQSETFYVLNTHLKQADSYDLLTHLKKYTPAATIATDYGWNLSHRPNTVPSFGSPVIGGGKYWICPTDHDFMTFFTSQNLTTITGFLYVDITYLDGTTDNDTLALSSMPVPFPAGVYQTHYLNAGIPNMSALFPGLTWTGIDYYTVFIAGIFIDIATQTYYVKNDGCCNDRIRIFFVNLLGGYDAIDFQLTEEITKATSGQYQKSKAYIDPSKRDRGTGRFQPQQSDFVGVWTEDYTEADMPWIKELIGSAQAYIQVSPDTAQGETAEFFPIEILDSELTTRKKDDNFVYNVSVKFRYSNEVINLRS